MLFAVVVLGWDSARYEFYLLCLPLFIIVDGFLGALSGALANSGVCVLICSGGGSGIYSLLVAFPRRQNHLHKHGRFSDDELLPVL